MNNLFLNEPLETIPTLNRKYYCSPIVSSKGFTHLMKLVLCANNVKSITLIKNILLNNPDEVNKHNEAGKNKQEHVMHQDKDILYNVYN